MEFADRQISCLDCGQPFTFTAGEQEFYDRKGFKEEPRRCKPCREARKARRFSQPGGGHDRGNGHAARSTELDDDIGNRAPATRGPREVRDVRNGHGRPPRELFDAVCAQCGAATRVPFRPVSGRPVYCRDCYGARGRGVGA